VLYIANDIKKRQGLADRLRTSGAAVKTETELIGTLRGFRRCERIAGPLKVETRDRRP